MGFKLSFLPLGHALQVLGQALLTTLSEHWSAKDLQSDLESAQAVTKTMLSRS